MLCSKCNKEMEIGYIPTYRDKLKWIKGVEQPSLLLPPKKRNTVFLSRTPFFTPEKVVGYFCPGCKEIVIKVHSNMNTHLDI